VVIITAFVIDVVLRAGTLEEAGSLVVVLRLWRVFKIIEEFSSGAEDQLAELEEKNVELQHQNQDLMKENEELKMTLAQAGATANGDVNSAESGLGRSTTRAHRHAHGARRNGDLPDGDAR
jgi:voltage-gated hydrogen channel 1